MLEDLKPFTFRTPRIVFKRESWKDLPKICAEFGEKGLLVTGTTLKDKSGIYPELMNEFEAKNLVVEEITRKGGEPTVTEVDTLAGELREEDQRVDWVLGIGGGSTLDLAKSAAGLSRNEGSAAEYQQGKDLITEGITFIAVPTTAGTGSEITNNAVLINEATHAKLSIRGDKMMAKVAVFDPVLTVSMSPETTAYSGTDALVQAIEAYVSKASISITDLLAEKAIEIIAGVLPIVYQDGQDIIAREQMLYGSVLSALSFSNAKLGAVHGFAHPIGALFNKPHGMICGILLPHIMRFNLDGELPDVIRKFAWIGRTLQKPALDGEVSDIEMANMAITKIQELLAALAIPAKLSEIGLTADDIPAIVADTKGSSLANNPRDTSKELLEQILTVAM
ncbi:MAG TPA: iron-containing alcohol dehydrogenase [Candidatus Lokiarchaeia archaeon]|nr:iron-containing alcohol dehydrogenase [Candidatus Lokiarchaeia archaeon]